MRLSLRYVAAAGGCDWGPLGQKYDYCLKGKGMFMVMVFELGNGR